MCPDLSRGQAGGPHPPDAQLPLFAIDRINAKCGVDTVYMAPMHGERGSAPRRIPFWEAAGSVAG